MPITYYPSHNYTFIITYDEKNIQAKINQIMLVK